MRVRAIVWVSRSNEQRGAFYTFGCYGASACGIDSARASRIRIRRRRCPAWPAELLPTCSGAVLAHLPSWRSPPRLLLFPRRCALLGPGAPHLARAGHKAFSPSRSLAWPNRGTSTRPPSPAQPRQLLLHSTLLVVELALAGRMRAASCPDPCYTDWRAGVRSRSACNFRRLESGVASRGDRLETDSAVPLRDEPYPPRSDTGPDPYPCPEVLIKFVSWRLQGSRHTDRRWDG